VIKGIDKGTTYTKDHEGNIIKSTVREINDEVLIDGKLIVDFEGKKYVIGEKGHYSTDLEKANHNNTRILVYTLIALSEASNYIKTNLVLGLPIGLYSKNKVKMRQLFDTGIQKITINNREIYIQILNVEVFPEAAAAFYTQSSKDALVIDIGGLSIDTALMKNSKLEKYSTYSMGTMKLYSKIANKLNGQYDLSLTEWDIQDIFKDGLYIYGEKQDLEIDDILEAHTLEIIERLKLEYDLKVINNVLLTGGGSILLQDYIETYIPQAKVIDSTFGNARGLYSVGKVIFNE